MAHKILIVEDSPANRMLFRDILTYHGFEIVEAENGREGVRIARETRPALILMDLQMPLMNGYSAIKMLKSDPETKDILIIAVTSFAMVGDKEKALEAGADAYIAKPIDTRKLPEIIRSMLNWKNAEQ